MSDNYNNDPQEQQTHQGYQQPGGFNQQHGYNPQQGGYNPQQHEYNPQQGGYNPQQQGCNPQQQCVYTPPPQPLSPVISMGDWLINYLVLCIPLANIVMLCIWAFSSTTNPTKANWAKAHLVFAVIYIIFMIVIITVMFGFIAAAIAQENSCDQFY